MGTSKEGQFQSFIQRVTGSVSEFRGPTLPLSAVTL
jgi:hypothetical protein